MFYFDTFMFFIIKSKNIIIKTCLKNLKTGYLKIAIFLNASSELFSDITKKKIRIFIHYFEI